MDNVHTSEPHTLDRIKQILRESMPPGWTLDFDQVPIAPTGRCPDALISLAAPDGKRALFVGEVKREAFGHQLRGALDQLDSYIAEVGLAQPLFMAPWISAASRKLLSEQGISFADATGNIRLIAKRPGLYISRTGAEKNPWPTDSALKSLRGKGTMRALRALLDFKPPYGVRELAGKSSASPATLSRVIEFLDREDVLDRNKRGIVTKIDWSGVIRLWSQDYDVLRSNQSTNWLQPRGTSALIETLQSTTLRYALTGSTAAQQLAPIAPAKLVMVYVDNFSEAAATLNLKPAEAGVNVILLLPFDTVVYERTIDRGGLQLVNPTQLATDLLTGPGRAPSEGEALISWMKDNEYVWQS